MKQLLSVIHCEMLRVVFAALQLAAATGSAGVDVFKWEGTSHYDLGFQMGVFAAPHIRARLAQPIYYKWLVPWATTSVEGVKVYDDFLRAHVAAYPDYIDEILGMAEGANVTFAELFVINTKLALTYFAPAGPGSWQRGQRVDQCTDYFLRRNEDSANVTVLAHNEDAGNGDAGHTFIAHVRFRGDTQSPSWSAFVSAGALPTGGFGWNSNGLAFTLNYVAPLSGAVRGGIARAFVGRDMLEARDFDDLKRRVLLSDSLVGSSAGHNHQLLDCSVRPPRAVGIETGPGHLSASTVLHSRYAHENLYLYLDVAQAKDPGSDARAARIAQLPPARDASEVLEILSDAANRRFPIFHAAANTRDETGLRTLATVSFDAERCVASKLLPLYFIRNPSHNVTRSGAPKHICYVPQHTKRCVATLWSGVEPAGAAPTHTFRIEGCKRAEGE